LLGAAMGVQAHEAGDVLVRFGAANVSPNDDSSTVTLNGAPAGALGGSAAEVGVEDDTQLGLTIAYMLTKNVGIELLAATPFRHDIYGNTALKNSAVAIDKVGSTKHLPPTLSVQYYFDTGSALTPYVGVGLNYTTFFSEDTSSEFDGAVGHSSMDLDDSWGLAGQLGVDYTINDNWMVNAAVWYIDIDTDATIDTPLGKVEADVQIDPLVYMMGVGYKF
jgi:outer membrane protein